MTSFPRPTMGKGEEMSSFIRFALLSALAGSVVVVPAQPAAAAEPRQERGRTVKIIDGDTIEVDIWGDGTSRPKKVRFTGVNANEVGQCHASAATARTRGLALGKLTHLYALKKSSVSQGRLRRTVLSKQGNGTWVNLAKTLVSESLANASPIPDEWYWNDEYRAIQDQEMLQRQRLWNDSACGAGPDQTPPTPIDVVVHPQGGVGSEYVEITNQSLIDDLRLGGWMVRNTSPFHYRFPAGTTVPPGETLTVHVGNQQNRPLHHYWHSTSQRFWDPTGPPQHVGNGAFVVDPHVDIRAWDLYPT